jgi:hypothetical protein
MVYLMVGRGRLEFFIELVPQGELTPHLYKLQKDDTLLFEELYFIPGKEVAAE